MFMCLCLWVSFRIFKHPAPQSTHFLSDTVFRLALELHRIFRYFTDPLQYFQHIIKRTSELMLVKSNRMVSR